MSEPYVPLARAFHDLNGVHTIEITGWPGRCEVKPHAISNPGVSVLAPRRTSTEFWTFAPQQDGVLRCFTDLIADPHLLTDPGEPMVILLPADRIDSICIGFRDGAELITRKEAAEIFGKAPVRFSHWERRGDR